MRRIKALTLVSLGIVVGAVLGGWTQSAWAKQYPVPKAPPRMSTTLAGWAGKGGEARVQFIRDTVSGGCWILTSRSDGGDAIAVAPPAACNGVDSQ